MARVRDVASVIDSHGEQLPIGVLLPLLLLTPQNYEPWWWSSIAIMLTISAVVVYRGIVIRQDPIPAWLASLRSHSGHDYIGTISTPLGQSGPSGYFWIGPGYCTDWSRARIDATMTSDELRAVAALMDAKRAEYVALSIDN